MKIFSNFDTELDTKLYEDYSSKYWKDRVILIYRDKIFFIFHILLPAIVYIFLVLVFFFIFWKLDFGNDGNTIKWIVFFIGFLISFFIMWWKLLKRFIDYKMDFAIVTPNEIISYNQTGFFSRQARTIDVEKLKTISVDKKWLLNSIFNYWTLVFLSEWDDHWQWGIELYYVWDPDNVKRKVMDIVKFWIEELHE